MCNQYANVIGVKYASKTFSQTILVKNSLHMIKWMLSVSCDVYPFQVEREACTVSDDFSFQKKWFIKKIQETWLTGLSPVHEITCMKVGGVLQLKRKRKPPQKTKDKTINYHFPIRAKILATSQAHATQITTYINVYKVAWREHFVGSTYCRREI